LIDLPQPKLDALLHRHALVERELSTNLAPEAFVKLSREHAELTPVIDAIKAYRAAESEIADLDALIADPSTDGEMKRLAEAEKPALQARSEKLAHDIRISPVPHVRALRRQAGLEDRSNIDVDILDLGQHGDGCCRSMDASRSFGVRHALNAVDA
jgi:peptide chain release factor 1